MTSFLQRALLLPALMGTCFTLSACRSDTTSVNASACETSDCGFLETEAATNAVVALGDISARITPTLSAPVRAALDAPVARLFAAIAAQNVGGARLAMAQTYDALAANATQIDPADVSAIRLALAPAARVLGISTPAVTTSASPTTSAR